jgi:hypothetical protein
MRLRVSRIILVGFKQTSHSFPFYQKKDPTKCTGSLFSISGSLCLGFLNGDNVTHLHDLLEHGDAWAVFFL